MKWEMIHKRKLGPSSYDFGNYTTNPTAQTILSAISFGAPAIVRKLCETFPLSSFHPITPFIEMAVESGEVEMVILLIDELGLKIKEDSQVLARACYKPINLIMVRALIERGAPVSTNSHTSTTSLALAAAAGDIEVKIIGIDQIPYTFSLSILPHVGGSTFVHIWRKTCSRLETSS